MAFNWLIFASILLVVQISLINGRAISDGSVGKISGDRFKHDRFGLSVEIPKNWTVMNEKDFDKLFGAAIRLNVVIPVFGMAKYPIGSSDNNPNIVAIAAEKDAEIDLCVPLVASRKLTSLIMSVEYEGDCHEIKINGMTFSKQEATIKLESSKNLYQTQYGYSSKSGHFITFTFAYFDLKDKTTLDGIMQSVSFSS